MLLVEDNPTDVFVIREVLEECSLNLSLHTVRDGQEALAFLRQLAGDEKASCPALEVFDGTCPRLAESRS